MKTCGAAPPVPVYRVLLIGENRHGLVARRAVLEQSGYQVIVCEGSEAGLEEFARDRFDLVITDYRMRGLNGAEVIARLKSTRQSVPVVLISSVANVLGLTEQNTGADAVLHKSANEVQHMTRIVGRLLGAKPGRKAPLKQRTAVAAAAAHRV